jgi:hypothetical protein
MGHRNGWADALGRVVRNGWQSILLCCTSAPTAWEHAEPHCERAPTTSTRH